jgi:hypothetical protein
MENESKFSSLRSWKCESRGVKGSDSQNGDVSERARDPRLHQMISAQLNHLRETFYIADPLSRT